MTDDRGEAAGNGPLGFATFIVRVYEDREGVITGVVEWVRTGEKMRFHRLAAISEVIAHMMDRRRET